MRHKHILSAVVAVTALTVVTSLYRVRTGLDPAPSAAAPAATIAPWSLEPLDVESRRPEAGSPLGAELARSDATRAALRGAFSALLQRPREAPAAHQFGGAQEAAAPRQAARTAPPPPPPPPPTPAPARKAAPPPPPAPPPRPRSRAAKPPAVASPTARMLAPDGGGTDLLWSLCHPSGGAVAPGAAHCDAVAPALNHTARTVRIYMPPRPERGGGVRQHYLIEQGLKLHPAVEMVGADRSGDADWVVWTPTVRAGAARTPRQHSPHIPPPPPVRERDAVQHERCPPGGGGLLRRRR